MKRFICIILLFGLEVIAFKIGDRVEQIKVDNPIIGEIVGLLPGLLVIRLDNSSLIKGAVEDYKLQIQDYIGKPRIEIARNKKKLGVEKYILSRDISEDEEVVIYDFASFDFWRLGPQANKIYRVLRKKSDTKFDVPSVEDFLSNLDKAIISFTNLPPDHFRYKNKITGEIKISEPEPDWEENWESEYILSKQQASLDLTKDIFNFFVTKKWGDLYTWQAKYFDFSDIKQKRFLELYLKIQKIGLSTFLLERALEKILIPKIDDQIKLLSTKEHSNLIDIYKSFRTCLSDEIALAKKNPNIIKNCGFKIIEEPLYSKLSSDEVSKFKEMNKVMEIPQISFPSGRDYFSESIFILPLSKAKEYKEKIPKLALTHGTSIRKLANIIQLGGLTSAEYALSKGIIKSSGGESGGKHSMHGDYVSFWGSGAVKGGPMLGFGYGEQDTLDYPISFAVSEKFRDRDDCPGKEIKSNVYMTWPNEVVVPNIWPLKCVDYLIAPWFAIEDIRDTLDQHNLYNINVVPYSIELFNEYGSK